MVKQVGIKEIAKLSNTSIGTVDRVLNNRTGVSPKTKQRVLEIVKQTGYVKNNIASRLKLSAGKKVSIAVVLPKVINGISYWNLPRMGVKKALNELSDFGVELEFIDFSSDDKNHYKKIVDEILGQNYDGIITVSLFEELSNKLVQYANKENKPLVFIDGKNDKVLNTSFIYQNSTKAGEVAGRLLYNTIDDDGVYIALTLVEKSEFQGNQKERELGFKNFLISKNPNLKIHSVIHTIDAKLDENKILDNLLSLKTKKGVFVTNSRSYIFAKFLSDKSYNNVKILGFDLNKKNIDYLKEERIQYLINQKPELQGYQSLMKIFQKITQDQTVSLNIDIPVEIIIKENLQDSNDIL